MKKASKGRPSWDVIRTKAGWHARLIARNGKIIAWTEKYRTRRACLNAIRVARGAP